MASNTTPTADEHTTSGGGVTTDTGDATDAQRAADIAEEAKVALAQAIRAAAAAGAPLAASDLRAVLGSLDDALRLVTRSAQSTQAVTLGAAAAGYWERITARAAATPTGLADLDEALGGGLQPGRVMVLLGGPGAGKTTFANQLGEHIAASGRPVVYLALEDASHVLTAKTLARVYDLDYTAVLNGHENQRQRITAALTDLSTRKSAERLLYVDDTGRLSTAQLAAIAGKHFERYSAAQAGASGGGPGLLVVDYLQRWARAQRDANTRDDTRQLVTDAVIALSNLSRELNCTVLALSSMNRQSGYGENGDSNTLASAKEAGDIEFSADVVAAIVKGKHDAPMGGFEARKLRLDKNRLGAVAEIELNWRKSRQQFTGVERMGAGR